MVAKGRRYKSVGAVVALAVVALGGSPSSRAQPARAPGSIRLLPGYVHEGGSGLDAISGTISKPSGPHIVYEVSAFRANMKDALLPSYITAVTRQETASAGPIEVILLKGDQMAVTFQDANFQAKNVKTKEDVVEVLLMVTMYASDRWKEAVKAPEQ